NGPAACVGSRETPPPVFIQLNAQGSDSAVRSTVPTKIRNPGDWLHVKQESDRNSSSFSAHLVPRETQSAFTRARAAPGQQPGPPTYQAWSTHLPDLMREPTQYRWFPFLSRETGNLVNPARPGSTQT